MQFMFELEIWNIIWMTRYLIAIWPWDQICKYSSFILELREQPRLKFYQSAMPLLTLQATQTMRPIKWQNWDERFPHFQIQPIKCPVQNNGISTCNCRAYALDFTFSSID